MGILTYTGLAWLADAAEMILLSFIGPAVPPSLLAMLVELGFELCQVFGGLQVNRVCATEQLQNSFT